MSIRTDELTLLLLRRLSIVAMWLAIIVFHLVPALAALIVLWILKIHPRELAMHLVEFVGLLPVNQLWMAVAAVVVMFLLWIMALRRIYVWLTLPSRFRELRSQMREP